MELKTNVERMTSINDNTDLVGVWIEAFVTDRKVQGKSKKTIRYYAMELKIFLGYLDTQAIEKIIDIKPDTIRSFMVYLTEKRKRNPGGVHAAYRAVKAFLFWYEIEVEPSGWKNPIRKVKGPTINLEPLEPISIDNIRLM